jgi:hypothetical protein
MPATRLSDHFLLSEFHSKDGAKVPAERVADVRRLCEWWLEPLRERFGAVTVYSGYRSAVHNEHVGGAAFSVHLLRTLLPGAPAGPQLYAAAADVACRTGRPIQWEAWARKHRGTHPHLRAKGRGGIGLYVVDGFVHLDTGPSRGWSG